VRRRVLEATIGAVTVAVVLLGVPLAVFGMLMVRDSDQREIDLRAGAIGRVIERRVTNGEAVDSSVLDPWIGGDRTFLADVVVTLPEGDVVRAGPGLTGGTTRATELTPSGALVEVSVSSARILLHGLQVVALVIVASVLAVVAGVLVGQWEARRLAAPLIYLAASAEQLGSGQVRPRIKPSGVEEIDLVAAELARSADRLAGRLAAERQFTADASHQLRTPLTALSMRLEEIQALADSDDVREEARISLEQVERLVTVVDDLLATSRRAAGGTTEVVHLDDVLRQQEEEWGRTFEGAGRRLEVAYDPDVSVLATPGGLAQVLATLIENSLKHGGGKTSIRSRRSGANGYVVEVADEGPGVPDDLAPTIFERNVTSGRGTGLGLARARDLVAADGGRLSLAQRRPAVFALFLSAAPRRLDPDVVLPPGALVVVGRRRRRR
jgi:signal transduction histidine kinase